MKMMKMKIDPSFSKLFSLDIIEWEDGCIELALKKAKLCVLTEDVLRDLLVATRR